MMGGLGSGRPSGSGHCTVEGSRSIDVNRLHPDGCLRAGWAGSWQWTRDGEKVASINLRAENERLHLTYRVRIGGGEWEEVAETVRIVRVACRFGGAGPYFVCPGVVKGIACGRRVAKLHGPDRFGIAIASRTPARGRRAGSHAAPRQQGSSNAWAANLASTSVTRPARPPEAVSQPRRDDGLRVHVNIIRQAERLPPCN